MRKILSLVVATFLTLSIIALSTNIWRSYKKLGGLENVRRKEQALRKETQDLKNKLKDAESKSFIEKESRNKLGLSKKGESIYIVEQKPTKEAPEAGEIQNIPNWKKWVNVFKD